MRKILLIAIAFASIAIFNNSSTAQSAKRVTFPKGSTSVVLRGTLSGYSYKTRSQKIFVIRVRKGQTLTTEDIGDNRVTVGIDAPKGSTWEPDYGLDCHSGYEIAPTVAGDYKLTVSECTKADAWRGTFKLKVTVH